MSEHRWLVLKILSCSVLCLLCALATFGHFSALIFKVEWVPFLYGSWRIFGVVVSAYMTRYFFRETFGVDNNSRSGSEAR